MRKLDIEPNDQLIEEPSSGGGISEYLLVARKYWLVIVLLLTAGIAGAILYTLRQPRIYQASASVIIDPSPPRVFGDQVQEVVTLGTGSFWSNREYYNTQVRTLQSFDLARRTVEENALANEPGLAGAKVVGNDEDQLILAATSTFASGLTARHEGDSRVVSVSVRLEDPELAVRLANLHIDTFLGFTVGLRSGGSGEASKFLAIELDRAEKRLRASEEALLEFKRANNLLSVSLEAKQSILATDMARYATALGDVRLKRTRLGASLKRAKKLLREDAVESPIFALTNNNVGVTELKALHATASHKLRELGALLGPKHPQVKEQEKQVEGIVGSLESEARRKVREMEERYLATLSIERQFQGELERLKTEAMELEPKTLEYGRLERKAISDSESYDMVLRRLRASDLSGRNEAINIRSHAVARSAVLVSPDMLKNVVSVGVLALLVGLGLAFLLDLLDRTIKNAEQVVATVGAPVLGVIPLMADGSHKRDDAVGMKERDFQIFNNPSSPVAECCRSIRTNILFAATDRRMKTLTISSPRPREGKSTTTIHLGTTMALSGQRVLLIDADLRRPRLHKAMDVSREMGLTTVLLGEASLEDAIKTTDVPNLYILPAGPQPPNPAELLLTERFQKLLEEIESKFDRILLDSPPLLAVSDSVVLSRLSDGVILVVQAGKTRIDDAVVAVRSLRDVNAPIVGVILNDVDLEDRRYGYGSRYYSYGYGEDAVVES